MSENDEATLTNCLRRSFVFQDVGVLDKMSSWRLCVQSFAFFAMSNFVLSLPALGVLTKLCPASHILLEILCLLIYTSSATFAMFFALFSAGFACAVAVFVLRRRYRFIEITNVLILSCSHVLLYPGSVLLAFSIFGVDMFSSRSGRCSRVHICVHIIIYFGCSALIFLYVTFLLFVVIIADFIFYIRNLRSLTRKAHLMPPPEYF